MMRTCALRFDRLGGKSIRVFCQSCSQYTVQRNKTGKVRITYIEARSCIRCCSGRAISRSVTYSVCVWSWVSSIMCHVICGLSSCTVFSTLSHKRHDFQGGELLNLKCVFRFSLRRLSETFFILRRTAR